MGMYATSQDPNIPEGTHRNLLQLVQKGRLGPDHLKDAAIAEVRMEMEL